MEKSKTAKRLVLETCLRLADQGYLPATGGNVAVRVSNDTFAVTPSAMDYGAMQEDDICVLDLNTLERLAGEHEPSVESGIHAALLRFRTDFAATIHTHQPLASAVSLLNAPLPTEPGSESALGEVVPIVPYAPSGTGFLLRAFTKCLRSDVAAYLLRNHGLVCGGATVEIACENTMLVERAAARFLRRQIESRQSDIRDPALLAQALAAVE